MSDRRQVIPLPLGDDVPFSKGLLARALIVTGLDPERAHTIARRADQDLAARNATSLDIDRLGELTADVIGDDEAYRTIRRLRRLDALQRLDEPLLLLVGGATGSGSRGSRPRTSSDRPCARSSRRSSCPPSTTRASRRVLR